MEETLNCFMDVDYSVYVILQTFVSGFISVLAPVWERLDSRSTGVAGAQDITFSDTLRKKQVKFMQLYFSDHSTMLLK